MFVPQTQTQLHVSEELFRVLVIFLTIHYKLLFGVVDRV